MLQLVRYQNEDLTYLCCKIVMDVEILNTLYANSIE